MFYVYNVFPSGIVIAFSFTQPTVAIAKLGAVPSVEGDSVSCALFCGASSVTPSLTVIPAPRSPSEPAFIAICGPLITSKF